MRKVLFIAYFLPPLGGTGVIRITKFVKYLPTFGWRPYVLTVEKGFYPIEDRDLLSDIPKEAKITRVKYFEPGFLFKSKLWRMFLSYVIYPWLLIPDNQILWFFPALWSGYKQIKQHKIKIIFTSASSYTDHLVALVLKKITHVKWVADFRDQWTDGPYCRFPTFGHKKICQFLEKKILANADYVTTVSEGLTDSYRKKLVSQPSKFITVTNGFDEDDFRNLKPQTKGGKKLKIIYSGTFYGSRRLDVFLKVLSELNLKDINLEIIGDKNRLPYKKMIEKLIKADVLLLILGPSDGPAILTGKIFEYLATRKPILALAPADSGAAKLVKKLKVGEVCDPSDEEEIKTKILKIYQKWLENKLKISPAKLENYSRKNLTKKLSKIFKKISQNSAKIRLCLIGNVQSAQNQNLCQYFVRLGYEVHFISTKKGSLAGVRVHHLGRPQWTPLYFVKSALRIKWFLKQIKPDILHGQDLVFGGIWAYLSGFHPYVVTPWGSDVMNYERFIAPEKYLIKKTLEQADLVTVSSMALQQQAEEIGLAKNTSRIIHFGIDLDVFKKSVSKQSKIIFCPRAIGPIYNTDILIKSFVEVAKIDKKVKLALLNNVADLNFYRQIKNLITRYDLTARVIFWPKTPNNKMSNYYNKAEVIVTLSSSDGCSVSFLEAMAMEKKIVVTDLPYLKEWKMNGNIWTVPLKDYQTTAETIVRALEFPVSHWQKIGKFNRQLVAEKAELKSNFDKLDKLYKDIG